MSQLVIVHKNDAKQIALQIYAFFRNRFQNAIVKPNTQSFINDGLSLGQGIFNTDALIVVVSDDWSKDNWFDKNNTDAEALKIALKINKLTFVLRLNSCQLPDDLPDNISNLRNMMSFDVTNESLYQVLEIITNYVAPMLGGGETIIDPLPPESYPPNPKYPESGRIIHKKIDPSAFQHELDKMATENLRKVRGFDTFAKKFLEFGVERTQHILFAANGLKVSSSQYPKLHNMLQEASTILDMPPPDMYVILGDQVNAFTFGHSRPYIVIYTPLLDMMTDDEIMAVISHELGHIKCSHVLYNTMSDFAVPVVSEMVGNIPIVGDFGKLAFDVGMQVALLTWSRRSELSADRASLLVMQDPEPCISMLAKLAGGSVNMQDELNLEAFIEQAEEYQISDDTSNVDKFYKMWAFMQQTTHPFPVERARFLNDYIDGVEYEQIMNGIYARTANEK